MNTRTIIVVVLALVCGLGAAIGIRAMKPSSGAGPVETRAVVLVAADITRGQVIPAPSIEVRQVPKDQATELALANESEVVGRIARIPMLKGDVVTNAKLEPKGAKSRTVPAGKQAFTISKADMPTLEVDDHVDVYFTINGSSGRPGANKSLQNITVWEVTPPSATNPASSVGPVTLLVDPEQADDLNQGLNAGTLRLARRNAGDPIRKEMLAPPPEPTSEEPRLMVTHGKRAFTIHAPSPSPFLTPKELRGEHVDVLLTPRPVGATESRLGESAAYLLLQDVEILAAKDRGTSPSLANSDKATEGAMLAVTVLVDPGDAGKLAMGQNAGSLHLSLRNRLDHRVHADPPALRKRTHVTILTLKGTRLGQDTLAIFDPIDQPDPPPSPKDALSKAGRP